MDSREEMKVVRNFLRRQVKQVNNDPYLSFMRGRLSARIVKWDKRAHWLVVCVRDISKPETRWDSEFCQWVQVYTNTSTWKWKLWQALNEVVVKARPRDFQSPKIF